MASHSLETYKSLAQPFLALKLDASNKEDVELLQQATQNFTIWTDELQQMDRQLYELLKRDGYSLDTPAKPQRSKRARMPKTPVKVAHQAKAKKQPKTPAERQLAKYQKVMGKSLTADNLLALLRSLQKDIHEGKIRKTDPLSKSIAAMQKELVKLYEAAASAQSCVIASEALNGLSGCGCKACGAGLYGLGKPSKKFRLNAAIASKLTKGNTALDVWEERDRLSIVLSTKKSGTTLAEWWDEGARDMFESGWFERKDLHSSVINYLKHIYGAENLRGLSDAPRTIIAIKTPAEKQLAKYRALQGKTKTAPEIERLVRSLQRDVESGAIVKGDPLAGRIQTMQKTLVRAYARAEAEGCVRFTPSPETLGQTA